ncbi:MAG: hypothetical protein ACRENP_00890 [Longimicrobiales bacterium]
MMRKAPLFLVSIVMIGCHRSDPEGTALSGPVQPAAALASLGSVLPLDQALAMVERELTFALRGEGDVAVRLEIAETITDRLLETQLPFAWITSRSYSVEPMLRQIQALADRIIAERRSGEYPDVVRRDMTDLLELVQGLRAGLKAGGGPQPASLDSLLARYAADTLAASPVPGRGE